MSTPGPQRIEFPVINMFHPLPRWRNSVGLGVFIVVGQMHSSHFLANIMTQVKDCVSLLHLYLTKREIQTRRVKNKSFRGIDVRGLDLIPMPPPIPLL